MCSQIIAERTLNASLEAVWEVCTDIAHADKFIPGIEKIEVLEPQEGYDIADASSFGLGFKWKETRIMFGQSADETMHISALDPLKSYGVTSAENCGTVYQTITELSRCADGRTHVSTTMWGEPKTLVARIMGVLCNCLMRRSVRQALEKDLESVGAEAERRVKAK